MSDTSTVDKLSDFRQELSFILRSTHCLIEDTNALNPDLIMGMLHTERNLLNRLDEIICEVKRVKVT